jgi:hypothetical protein
MGNRTYNLQKTHGGCSRIAVGAMLNKQYIAFNLVILGLAGIDTLVNDSLVGTSKDLEIFCLHSLISYV